MMSVDKINYDLRSFILREGVPRKRNFDTREGKLVCFTFRITLPGLRTSDPWTNLGNEDVVGLITCLLVNMVLQSRYLNRYNGEKGYPFMFQNQISTGKPGNTLGYFALFKEP